MIIFPSRNKISNTFFSLAFFYSIDKYLLSSFFSFLIIVLFLCSFQLSHASTFQTHLHSYKIEDILPPETLTPDKQTILHNNQNTPVKIQEDNNKLTWEGKDRATTIKDLRVYEKDDFRIFYFTDGVDKVNTKDLDKNNVPDYVEDVAKQMWATKYVFCNILDFPCPLNTHYYAGVKCIDIFIIHPDKLKGANGSTVTHPTQALLKPKGTLAVKILLSKGFYFSSSTTITHEYFHIIQNGMSQIKNLWFLEGLARWSEDVLHNKNYKLDPRWNYYKLLKNKDVLHHVQSLSYDAGKFFWIPLTLQLSKERKYTLDKDHILNTLKYSNNSPVLQDKVISGYTFIKIFLEKLSLMDDKIEKDYNFKEWNQINSHHKRNNSYIMKAIRLSLDEMKKSSNKKISNYKEIH